MVYTWTGIMEKVVSFGKIVQIYKKQSNSLSSATYAKMAFHKQKYSATLTI